MFQKEFFPSGIESIQVKFDCDQCGTPIVSDRIAVPSPDFAAEKAADSRKDNDGSATCGNASCKKEYTFTVWAGYADGYVESNQLPNDYQVHLMEHQEEALPD